MPNARHGSLPTMLDGCQSGFHLHYLGMQHSQGLDQEHHCRGLDQERRSSMPPFPGHPSLSLCIVFRFCYSGLNPSKLLPVTLLQPICFHACNLSSCGVLACLVCVNQLIGNHFETKRKESYVGQEDLHAQGSAMHCASSVCTEKCHKISMPMVVNYTCNEERQAPRRWLVCCVKADNDLAVLHEHGPLLVALINEQHGVGAGKVRAATRKNHLSAAPSALLFSMSFSTAAQSSCTISSTSI
jgi:hypothetical protein